MATQDLETRLDENSSFVVAKFGDIGSAEFALTMNAVTTNQLLALARYLEIMAENAIIEKMKEANRPPEPRLALPTMKLKP